MWFLLIIAVNLLWTKSLKYALVSDDSAEMKSNPFNVNREKTVNLILHTLVACYIYHAFGQSVQSLTAAILFSLHPSVIQVSMWISGRPYGKAALVFLFVLAFAPFSALSYFALPGSAMLLFTPLVFIFTKHWYIAFCIFPLAFLGYKSIKSVFSEKEKRNDLKRSAYPARKKDFEVSKFRWRNTIIAVKTFGFYSFHCILPLKNGFYNPFLVTMGTSRKATAYWYSINRHFWGGVFAVVTMVVLWWFNRYNFTGFGILLFILSIGPFLNFATVQQWTSPRYQYLPLIGIHIALAGILLALPIPLCSMITFALGVFYLDRSIKVMPIYKKNSHDMIMQDTFNFPDNPRMWYYRYEHHLNNRNPIVAWTDAARGLDHIPGDPQLYFGLSVASLELGDKIGASKFLKLAEEAALVEGRTNLEGLITHFKRTIERS